MVRSLAMFLWTLERFLAVPALKSSLEVALEIVNGPPQVTETTAFWVV
jgi:hypothetical protein